jgi:hypothetical protein
VRRNRGRSSALREAARYGRSHSLSAHPLLLEVVPVCAWSLWFFSHLQLFTPFCAGQTDQALRAGGPLHCTSVRLLPPGCAHRKCACAGYSRAAITRSPTARSLCVVSPPSRRPQESRLLPTAEPSFFNLFGFSSYLGTSRASIWSAAAAYSPSQPRYLALSSLIPNQV